jgi:hypothetical protein
MTTRLFALLVLSLSISGAAYAQVGDTRAYEPRVMPADASKRDSRYIGFYDGCGESAGLQQPVVLAPVEGTPTLRTLALRTNSTIGESLCFATTPFPFTQRLFLIELPPDSDPLILAVDVRISDRDGTLRFERRLYIPRQMDDVTPPSIAGTWNNPAHAGQGVHISFSPLPVGEADGVRYFGDGLVVAWTTYAADGNPVWLTGSALLDRTGSERTGYVTRVPLYRTRNGSFPGRTGPAATAEAWGSVDLEYLGCGALRMSWSANDDTAFPDGSMELSHLVHTSTAPCDLERFAYERAQRLDLIVPQLGTPPAQGSTRSE